MKGVFGLEIKMNNINNHFKFVEGGVDSCYEIAREARSKGFDPVRGLRPNSNDPC
jgi:hypothetical protein